jgi:sensor domain CHASE-containing protein
MAINFPNSPQIGEQVFIGTYVYTWTGDTWDRTVVAVDDLVEQVEDLKQNIDAGSSTTVFSVADITIEGGTSNGS